MPEIAVAIFSPNEEQRTVLQMQIDSSAVAKTVASFNGYPIGATDPALRRLRDLNPDVLIVDIDAENTSAALYAIELLHLEIKDCALFAIGDMRQPQTIVNAMRVGAREFLEKPTTTNQLLEAFVRVASNQRKQQSNVHRGKIVSFINAKGGCGATTLAVNVALEFQRASTSALLVDLAVLGNAALYLNLRSQFTAADALRNVGRLDSSLLDSLAVQHSSGLKLLAGCQAPLEDDLVANSDLARLFDVLVNRFRYVVVDLSTRVDRLGRIACELSDTTLVVATPDVAALWNASRVSEFINGPHSPQRANLILNRYRKIPGFTDGEAERLTKTKLLWKVPDHAAIAATAVDKGIPIVTQNNSELSRSLSDLASTLRGAQVGAGKRAVMSTIFRTA